MFNALDSLSPLTHALLTAAALGAACAVLSVVVVLRRWAFIGEGISHSGFGGIGTAWLLSLAFPALAGDVPIYLVAVLFCLGVAFAIGFFTRHDRVNSDAAIGIFLVASLAWGFTALALYQHGRPGLAPPDWERYLLGDLRQIGPRTMLAAVCVAAAVLVLVAFLQKEIFAYVFNPMLAQTSGVRAGFIHYLLMVLLALLIVIGMGLVGNLLVPALLVLPGAAALLLSRRLPVVMATAIALSLFAAIGGCLAQARWPFLPAGPAIVLILFLEFLATNTWSKLRQ